MRPTCDPIKYTQEKNKPSKKCNSYWISEFKTPQMEAVRMQGMDKSD